MSATTERLIERFMRYVRIHTTSAEGVEDRYPSTARQFDLARLLVEELRAMGLDDAAVDESCVVMATLPASLPPGVDAARVPTIAFFAHVDTYPETPGENVKPQRVRYTGAPIVLPGDPAQVIRPEENPELARHVGEEIVTSDGTTLLGADDKAGVAEIMEAVQRLRERPELRHGRIRVCFTPDEEVGHGADKVDLAKLGADVAYTMDGSRLGEVENETFCADTATVVIEGADVHPGYAKGRMTNAVRIAAEVVAACPPATSPETTEGREGYLHPYRLDGNVGLARVTCLVRDFTVEGLHEKERLLEAICRDVGARHPRARLRVEVKESYRNMRYDLERDPRVVARAIEAVRRAGVAPVLSSIRGGTDGARLTARGLLTPNIFAGGQAFHSKQEWVAVSTMEKAVEVIHHLAAIWAEGAAG
jgi:tripeptide aminopeptidase